MTTNNSINLSGSGICKYDGAGTFSSITVTNHALLIGAASNGITSLVLGAGQLPIGTTAGDPSAATLTAGIGINISSASGAITISTTGGGFAIVDVTGTTQAMSVNTAYFANNAGLVTLTLPATATEGDIIKVFGKGAGGWAIAQNASQAIHLGSSTTTTGVSGSLASTNQWDNVTLNCAVSGASTIWTISSPVGNITVV